MGSVYTRKGSRFLWLKYLQDGRVVRESSGTTNKSTARRMLRVREGDVERGIPIEPKVGRIFFDEAATDLLNDYIANGRRTHADTKRRIEKHLKPFFGDKRMSSITTSDIRAYVAKRQTDGWLVKAGRQADELGRTDSEPPTERRPVAAGEINRELTVLKRMFSLACKPGSSATSPISRCCARTTSGRDSSNRSSTSSCCNTCRRRFARSCASPMSPDGGSTARFCRCSGVRSI